jgi:Tfp pilus assembly protein PilN
MLVEINLLPQPKPKKFAFLIILTCLIASLLLVGGFYFWQIYSSKNEIASIDRQISMTSKIADKVNKKADTIQSTSSVSQLKTAIDWANDYPIQTIPVMRQLTALLPERGFIQSFGYTEAGTITLTVQFDSAREAAYFLDNLTESKWIEEASLSSLSAAATATDSTSASSTAPTNQTNTTSPTDASNQANTTTSNPNTGATTTTEGQTPNAATGTTVDQNSTVNTTTNTKTINNSAATSNSTTSTTVDKSILPRYTGQFEIKLNKDTVKKMISKRQEG